MAEIDTAAVERIIANTINETARGDPDALATRIGATLAEAGRPGQRDPAPGQSGDRGHRARRSAIRRADARKAAARSSRRRPEIGPSKPVSTAATSRTICPRRYEATDGAGRSALYVPLTRDGKIVVPRLLCGDDN
jgi:hypothetical protein